MDEQKRAKIELLVVELAKRHPQRVKEVWYNPGDTSPDNERSAAEAYFFICYPPVFEQRLFDEMTKLMMRVYKKMDEDITIMFMPLNSGFQRRIYSKDEKQ